MFLKYFLYAVIGSIVILFAQCKSDEDLIYPEITAMLPYEGSQYSVGDTIHFKVIASDNLKLKFIDIVLLDMNNKPVSIPETIQLPTNPFTWEGDYIINDSLLENGAYYIQFQTSDGTNNAKAFRKIYINEISNAMLYPIISTKTNDGVWNFYRLLQNNTWKLITSQNPDYSGIAVNSKKRILYTSGTTQTQLKAFDLPSDILRWAIEPHHISNLRWFEHISFYDPYLYVACADGAFRYYDADGICKYTSDIASNKIPSVFAVTNNLIISYMKGVAGNDNQIYAFHNTAGGIVHTKFIDSPVVDIQPLTNDKALVISNNTTESSIAVYNGTDNSFGKLHSYYDAPFTKLIKCNNDKFLIASTKGILQYTPSSNILVPFKSINDEYAVAYSPYEELVWIATNNHLYAYTFQHQELVVDIALPGKVTDIELMFTK